MNPYREILERRAQQLAEDGPIHARLGPDGYYTLTHAGQRRRLAAGDAYTALANYGWPSRRLTNTVLWDAAAGGGAEAASGGKTHA